MKAVGQDHRQGMMNVKLQILQAYAFVLNSGFGQSHSFHVQTPEKLFYLPISPLNIMSLECSMKFMATYLSELIPELFIFVGLGFPEALSEQRW